MSEMSREEFRMRLVSNAPNIPDWFKIDGVFKCPSPMNKLTTEEYRAIFPDYKSGDNAYYEWHKQTTVKWPLEYARLIMEAYCGKE